MSLIELANSNSLMGELIYVVLPCAIISVIVGIIMGIYEVRKAKKKITEGKIK